MVRRHVQQTVRSLLDVADALVEFAGLGMDDRVGDRRPGPENAESSEHSNQALRAGLSREMAPQDVEAPKTIPHSFGFRAGVDLDELNQLADELEAEAAAESLKRTR